MDRAEANLSLSDSNLLQSAYGPFQHGKCNTNLFMFVRTRTTDCINKYMIYAGSSITLQPE